MLSTLRKPGSRLFHRLGCLLTLFTALAGRAGAQSNDIANFEIINTIPSASPCKFTVDGVESQWKGVPFLTATGALGIYAGSHELEITSPGCTPYSDKFSFKSGPVSLIVAVLLTTFDEELKQQVHRIETRVIPAKPTPDRFSLSFYSVSKKPLAKITYGGIHLEIEPEKLVTTKGWDGSEFDLKLEGGGTFRVRTDRAMHYIVIICDGADGELAATSTLCY